MRASNVWLHGKEHILSSYGQTRLRHGTWLLRLCTKSRTRQGTRAAWTIFPNKSLDNKRIEIPGLLSKKNKSNQLIKILAVRCTNLTRSIPSPEDNAITVARIFLEHWVVKFGIRSELLTEMAFNSSPSSLWLCVVHSEWATVLLSSVTHRRTVKAGDLTLRLCQNCATMCPNDKRTRTPTYCHRHMHTSHERTDLSSCSHSTWQLS